GVLGAWRAREKPLTGLPHHLEPAPCVFNVIAFGYGGLLWMQTKVCEREGLRACVCVSSAASDDLASTITRPQPNWDGLG
ncbi:hypothetical protein J4Q44_G00374730, partial [Coregonus suidteri]